MKCRVNYGIQSEDKEYISLGHQYFKAETLSDAKRKATVIVSHAKAVIDWFNFHNDKYGWNREKPTFRQWRPDKSEQERFNNDIPYYNEDGKNFVRRFSEQDYSRKEFVSIYVIWKGDFT